MSERINGYDAKIFVSKPCDGYLCPLCLNIMNNVKQCVNGHCFCCSCIENALVAKKECPVCMVHLSANMLGRNLFAQNGIQSLITYCISNFEPSSFNGADCCTWTGALSEREAHYEDSCGYKLIKCPNTLCPQSVLRKLFDDHTNECSFRMVVCKYCNESCLVSELSAHNLTCLTRPVVCPNNCSVSVTKDTISRHLTECPLQLVDCPYWKQNGCYQCNGKVVRSGLEVHLSSSQRTIYVIARQGDMIQQLLKNQKQLEAKYNEMQAQFNKVQSEFNSKPLVEELTESFRRETKLLSDRLDVTVNEIQCRESALTEKLLADSKKLLSEATVELTNNFKKQSTECFVKQIKDTGNADKNAVISEGTAELPQQILSQKNTSDSNTSLDNALAVENSLSGKETEKAITDYIDAKVSDVDSNNAVTATTVTSTASTSGKKKKKSSVKTEPSSVDTVSAVKRNVSEGNLANAPSVPSVKRCSSDPSTGGDNESSAVDSTSSVKTSSALAQYAKVATKPEVLLPHVQALVAQPTPDGKDVYRTELGTAIEYLNRKGKFIPGTVVSKNKEVPDEYNVTNAYGLELSVHIDSMRLVSGSKVTATHDKRICLLSVQRQITDPADATTPLPDKDAPFVGRDIEYFVKYDNFPAPNITKKHFRKMDLTFTRQVLVARANPTPTALEKRQALVLAQQQKNQQLQVRTAAENNNQSLLLNDFEEALAMSGHVHDKHDSIKNMYLRTLMLRNPPIKRLICANLGNSSSSGSYMPELMMLVNQFSESKHMLYDEMEVRAMLNEVLNTPHLLQQVRTENRKEE